MSKKLIITIDGETDEELLAKKAFIDDVFDAYSSEEIVKMGRFVQMHNGALKRIRPVAEAIMKMFLNSNKFSIKNIFQLK